MYGQLIITRSAAPRHRPDRGGRGAPRPAGHVPHESSSSARGRPRRRRSQRIPDPLPPTDGAFYAFPDIAGTVVDRRRAGRDVAPWRSGSVSSPGRVSVGRENHIRVSYANSAPRTGDRHWNVIRGVVEPLAAVAGRRPDGRPTKVFVARRIPEDGLPGDRRGNDATVWPDELPPPRADCCCRRRVRPVVVTLLTDRVDPEFLDAAVRSSKVVSNYAVDFRQRRRRRCTARGIPVGNTPGVLTERPPTSRSA